MALLGCCASIMSAQALAQEQATVTVLKMLERSSMSPATMCFILDSRQSIVNDANNLINFVQVSTQAKDDVALNNVLSSMDDNMLCVSGLKPGQKYNLNLKQGLKLTSGKNLSADVKVPFAISDAQSQIKLPYNMILPKNNYNNSFVIETLNQSAFKLNIYRLSTRSMNELDLYELMNNNISNYPLVSLITNNARLIYSKTFDLSSGKSIEVESNTSSLQNAEPSQKLKLYKPLPADLRNQPLHTEIKLSDFVTENDDGIYLVLATDPRIDPSEPSNLYGYNTGSLALTAKLLMFTDLGLTTYQSADGLLTNVRSLTGARNMSGVKIELIAANNEILASGFTDDKGTVIFGKEAVSGKNALRPIALVAHTAKDVYSLDLRSSPLYIEGNQGKARSVDDFETFAYTDRGIYRPGDVVHYTALVRDTKLQAIDAPLTLTIYNHQGNEVERVLLKDSLSGGYAYDFKIAQGSGLGSYTATLSLGKKQLSHTTFAVGSMIPLQINSEILNNDKLISIDSPYTLKSHTSFNYGSNASNLAGQFIVTRYPDLKPIIAANKAQAEALKDFHFGIDKREQSRLTREDQFYSLRTDVEGILQQQINLKPEDYPQKMTVTSQVFDTNGQAVLATRNFKLAYNRPLIGIKQLPSQNNTSFALCSYLQDGSTFPQDVKYYLYKEFTDYNFVLENGSWKYVTFKSKKLIDQGLVKVDNQDLNKALIKSNLDDGNYLIELKSDKSATSFAFNKGFTSATEANTPETIQVFVDKKLYNVGDEAILSFESPFNGFANLAVGRQTINSFKTFSVKKGHNEVRVPLNDVLFPQGHALLSLYSPITSNKPGVVRVVGMADLNMDLDSHKIVLNARAPEAIKPNSTLTVKLQAIPGDPQTQLQNPYARVTLVDNGILQLTNFKAPDPNASLMQDRIFNVQLFDAYGYIMQDPKQQGQGYGATAEKIFGMQQDGSVTTTFDAPIKGTALASKIVPLNKDGQAEVAFELPEFSGSLKVMAVAWDQNKTGSSHKDVLVRDNAVASLGLPRFLNEDDESLIRLNLHNLKSTDPEFKIDLSCHGALQCSQQSLLNLKAGARNDVYIKLKALHQGQGTISLKVMNKDFNHEQDYNLTVTTPQLPMLNTQSYHLEPNSSLTVDLSRDYQNIQGAMIASSLLPDVNPQLMVRQIDRAAWGLQDNIASLESKLLYGSTLLKDLADTNLPQQSQEFTQAKFRSKAELNDAIQSQIDSISAQLNYSNSESTNFNLVYATDILLKAHAQGFNINFDVIERQLESLRRISDNFNSFSLGTYANAVLSRIESVNPASLRYALDERQLSQPVQLAWLAQALFQIGDTARAEKALEKAINNLLAWQNIEQQFVDSSNSTAQEEKNKQTERFRFNETNFKHDAYVVLDTCLMLKQEQKVLELVDRLTTLKETTFFMPALTMAAMLRTNHDLTFGFDSLNISNQLSTYSKSENDTEHVGIDNVLSDVADPSLNAAAIKEGIIDAQQALAEEDKESSQKSQGTSTAAKQSVKARFLDATQASSPIELRNDSKQPMFKTITVLGTQIHDKIMNKGIAVRINYFNKNEMINPESYNFRLNEEVLMEVNIQQGQQIDSDSLVKIKLPAGFEFVRTAVPEDPSFAKLLKNINIDTTQVETSDDLVVAKYSRYNNEKNRSLFLVLRAALPGTYSQGEALVQMQQVPQIFGTYLGSEKLVINSDK